MEVELFGNTYRVGKLDAMRQFHIARRLAPVISAVGLSVSKLGSLGVSLKDANVDDLLSSAGPVLDMLSGLSDEDTEYIIKHCMAVTARKVIAGGGNVAWGPVMTNGMLQYADMTMPQMIRITVEVLKENLGGFFSKPSDEPSSEKAS